MVETITLKKQYLESCNSVIPNVLGVTWILKSLLTTDVIFYNSRMLKSTSLFLIKTHFNALLIFMKKYIGNIRHFSCLCILNCTSCVKVEPTPQDNFETLRWNKGYLSFEVMHNWICYHISLLFSFFRASYQFHNVFVVRGGICVRRSHSHSYV